MYVTVLDEMNIARVEYYFAEFLSVLEMPDPERRLIEIVSDSLPNDPKRIIDGKIKLPENMWYVGTANNDDSTMAISDKVYDRAMIIDLDRRALPFDAPETEPYAVSYDKLAALVTSAKRRYGLTLRNRRRIERLDAYLIENLGITFGNRIMRQIESYVPVYVACGGSELEAIDTVLAKKVLRKLESKNPVYVRNAASALSLYLDELFSEGSMPVCRAMLAKFDSQK
jgi:5-methylcytosine-specific restriction endonuclease McrBC GTP-binding regulatory subunit McrB